MGSETGAKAQAVGKEGLRAADDQPTPAAIAERSYPGLEVACVLDPAELWQFFRETNFLYPEKIAHLQPFMPEVERTVAALLSARGILMETVVLRKEGVLCGHVCALRAHQRTWSFQHLAARPLGGRHLDTSARVNLALVYYAEMRPDVEWLKMFFRPNNPWPTRVFGGYAKLLNEPATSDLRIFHYLTAATSGANQFPSAIQVHPANSGQLPLVEEWFASRGRNAEVMANDLRVPETELRTIGEQFAKFGLTRRREILVAERNGRLTGFALLEVSSLGMNFSELTNAFRVHLIEEDPESRLALVLCARERYAKIGRTQCVALEENEDLSAFETAGFVKSKDYTCWTFHRSHLPALEEHFVRLFSDRRPQGV